ncbi:hypothetical protein O6H91_21G070100 [Diphasiastrum complanatum]|uniref:Uncharacterized protein n=1 Tax=Diphasiastrum complanatum TaxID=34168 RepID=A0ACC2ALR1_DIPCM|nr:hypothetical protein O6H91_21G070100 [Diphasiastrum complanatum]
MIIFITQLQVVLSLARPPFWHLQSSNDNLRLSTCSSERETLLIMVCIAAT